MSILDDLPTRTYSEDRAQLRQKLPFPGSILSGWITDQDLLLPSQVQSKGLGSEYYFAAHNPHPGSIASIERTGLKPLTLVAADQLAAEREGSTVNPSLDMMERYMTYRNAPSFSVDPSVIYLRPIIEGGPFKVHPESLVFAVRPQTHASDFHNEKGREGAYDPEFRETHRANPRLEDQRNMYTGSGLNYKKFASRSRQVTPEGSLLNKRGQPEPLEESDQGYWPEVLLKPTRPDIKWSELYAIPHDKIPEECKFSQLGLKTYIQVEEERLTATVNAARGKVPETSADATDPPAGTQSG